MVRTAGPTHPNAALAGFGLAYVPEDVASPHLSKGRPKRVLDDWRPPYSGYHLYYQVRGHPTQAFTLLVDTLVTGVIHDRYRVRKARRTERPLSIRANPSPPRTEGRYGA